jgi:hypothetical protein
MTRQLGSLVGSLALGICVAAAAGCSGGAGTTGSGKVTSSGGMPSGQAGSADTNDAGTDGAAPAVTPAGNTVFAVSYGDEGQQTMGGMASDADGNVYVVGTEEPQNTVTFGPSGRVFGPPEGTANGGFAVKYEPNGVLEWRQPFPVTGSNEISFAAVALQPTTGAVILAGFVRGSFTFDDGTTVTSSTNPDFELSSANLVLVALDRAGYLVWSRLYPSSFDVMPDSVFVDAAGNIAVVGRSTDNATVGGAPLCCLNHATFGTNTFIARFSPRGEPVASTAVTGGDFHLVGAGGAPDGGLVLGGSLFGSFQFDGQTFTGGHDLPSEGLFALTGAVLRIDAQSHLIWNRIFPQGGVHASSSVGATLDAAGNVILFGDFTDVLDLGNGVTLSAPNVSTLQTTGLLAKLGPGGTAIWAKQFQSNGFDTVDTRAAAADAQGNIALAGATAGGLSIGGPPVLPSGSSGNFVAKFDAGGTWLWNRGFLVQTSNQASRRVGVTVDGMGRVGSAGEFDNTVDFGTGPLTAPGQPTTDSSALPLVPDNIYVLKLAP